MKKRVVKTALLVVVFVIIVCVLPFWFGRYGAYVPQGENADATFLKLWHIDSFEGGSGNRAGFLSRVAVKYHAKNSSCFVVVQSLTEDEAINAISACNLPDLISFSPHVANNFCDKLQKLDVKNLARAEIQKFAEKDGKIYAVPWYMSGYCLIGNSAVDERVLTQLSVDTAYSFGKNDTKVTKYAYTAGLKSSYAQVAMLENSTARANLKTCDPQIFERTPFEAYSDFVKGNAVVLLGTARDFYRVQNRVSIGAMQACAYVPLQKFSDLIQYLGVLNPQQQAQCENFISFLQNSENQRALASVGLFPTTDLEIYADSEYKKFEKAMRTITKSINIFATADEKLALYKKAINAMC